MRKPKIISQAGPYIVEPMLQNDLLIVRPTAAGGKTLYALAMEIEAWLNTNASKKEAK